MKSHHQKVIVSVNGCIVQCLHFGEVCLVHFIEESFTLACASVPLFALLLLQLFCYLALFDTKFNCSFFAGSGCRSFIFKLAVVMMVVAVVMIMVVIMVMVMVMLFFIILFLFVVVPMTMTVSAVSITSTMAMPLTMAVSVPTVVVVMALHHLTILLHHHLLQHLILLPCKALPSSIMKWKHLM